MRHLLFFAAVALASAGGTAYAAGGSSTAPVLITAAQFAQMREQADRYPLFREELARARAEVNTAMARPVNVPMPKGAAGSPADEQHRRNWRAIHDAGLLYRITGDKRYADFVRRLLLAYADLYPQLGLNPSARGRCPGRLFWQCLNDANWVVYSVQGYDAIRDTLSDADRRRIDGLFREMAAFLSHDTDFNRIHNHGTWADAAVGMTGYVLRDSALVHQALYGTDGSGKAGFLRQMKMLFSPDGYYTEGPYYERYALLPFFLFARAIDANDPGLHIFARRNSILFKAVYATIQQTYDGYFFPINDSLKDKGIWTSELYLAIAVTYAHTHDDTLLSIVAKQNRTALSPGGLAVARAVAQGRAKPFPFASVRLSDGPDGKQGDLIVLRSDGPHTHQALVMKNTAQGMGHGHFDRLSWLFYDGGREVVTDYGSVRFLNVEKKDGGRYLPENKTWAKQTIAHNTLVVDQHSQFDGSWKRGQRVSTTPLFYRVGKMTKIAAARMDGAYPGVSFTRTLAVLSDPDFAQPVVVDLLKAGSQSPRQYDLPLHYHGQIITVGFPAKRYTAERPVLGKANGYQHLWVDAVGQANGKQAVLSWLLNDRFYSYRFIPPPGAKLILAESGANDPHFDLRHEPVLIQRVTGARDVTFVGVLEPHGRLNSAAETAQGESSRIAGLKHFAGADGDLIQITTTAGHRITLAVANDPTPDQTHRVTADGHPYEWQGYYARFDQ